MSSQHSRPLAAFILVSLMCAMVIVHSFRVNELLGQLRPGSFAVVEGPRQVDSSPSASRTLGASGGPFFSGSETVSVPRASATASAQPSRRASSTPSKVAAPRTSSPAPSAPPSDTGSGAPKPTSPPTTTPVTPQMRKLAVQLDRRVDNLVRKVAQTAGPRHEVLEARLVKLQAVLDDLLKLIEGAGQEPTDPGAPPTDPGAPPSGSTSDGDGQQKSDVAGTDAGPDAAEPAPSADVTP